MTKVSVIILSKTADNKMLNMLNTSINSLEAAERGGDIELDIIVVESGEEIPSIDSKNVTFLKPDVEFNYNKFFNFGIDAIKERGIGDYILFSNNDVEFHFECISIILFIMDLYDLDSASPWEPKLHPTIYKERKRIYRGYRPRRHLAGWNFIISKEGLDKITPLDEAFSFWYADNDYGMCLKKKKLSHALVRDAEVSHREQKSHRLLTDKKAQTSGLREVFMRKWKDTEEYKTRFRDPENIESDLETEKDLLYDTE